VEQARHWLQAASSVVVLTGAGISAESGIPTFRGSDGLWKQYKPEDLATPRAFAKDPRLVWEWYDWRRSLIARAEPNAGHRALAQLESTKPNFTLITQNVDGLHERAGSRRVLKVHGDIWRMECSECGRNWPDRRVPLPKLPPHCGCGAIARPGVVWFGEPLGEVWAEAEHAAREARVLLVVGTSAVVYPAAELAPIAQSAGARVIEINPEQTPLSSHVDLSLRGAAGEILPRLLASMSVGEL
jgi:NAD-dependent protein deacetylase/lipoamidase